MNTQEEEILKRAIGAFDQETGRTLRVLKTEVKQGNDVIDAVIGLDGEKFNVEVKRWAQQANFGALVYQIKQLPGRGVLVADYINKKMAKRFKDEGVHFLDTAGNAYMDLRDVYINVRGNDPKVELTTKEKRKPAVIVNVGKDDNIRPEQRRGTGRAFTPTGMKVVFEFLKDPKLVNAPYRDIAGKADVALGTVGWVINDLKARRVVVDRGREKQIREMKPLIQAWVETYPLKLRRKCLVGDFVADNPYWWQVADTKKLNGQWGGETAAALMTRYLKPQKTTIYIREDIGKLVQAVKLKKAVRPEEANVEILKPFWQIDEPGDTVHPIVVYADLIATSNARNLEVARLLYDEFIDKHHS